MSTVFGRPGDGARLARRWVQAALALLIVLIVLLCAAGAFAVRRIYTLGNTRYLKQAAPIYAATQDVLVQMLNEETGVRGYVITADPSTLQPYDEGKARVGPELVAIGAEAGSDPRIPAQLAAVKVKVAKLERYYARQIALVRRGPAGQRVAQGQVLIGKADFDQFRILALELEADAGRVVARAQHEQHDTYRRSVLFLGLAGLVALLVALGLLLRVPRRLVALYRSEEQARRAAQEGAEAARSLAHVTEAVVLLDEQERIRYWNPAAARLFGVAVGDAVGASLDDVAPALRDLAATPGPTTRASLPVGTRWLSLAESRFEGGRVLVVRDQTPDHELERVRTEFVATAAHELRTPLAAIYGAVRTLRRSDYELPEGAQEQFLAMIESESERLRHLMDQLLTTAQLDRDTLHVRREQVDLIALCRGVVETAELGLPPALQIVPRFDGTPVTVQADPERLRQVVANLLDNAIKYSPAGGRVEVRVTARDGHGVVDVSDQGIGIPASEHGRIFEKFYRLDPGMTRGVGGSGLGLYIIRELVSRMGGTVTLESQPGQGSTFTVTLPR